MPISFPTSQRFPATDRQRMTREHLGEIRLNQPGAIRHYLAPKRLNARPWDPFLYGPLCVGSCGRAAEILCVRLVCSRPRGLPMKQPERAPIWPSPVAVSLLSRLVADTPLMSDSVDS